MCVLLHVQQSDEASFGQLQLVAGPAIDPPLISAKRHLKSPHGGGGGAGALKNRAREPPPTFTASSTRRRPLARWDACLMHLATQ